MSRALTRLTPSDLTFLEGATRTVVVRSIIRARPDVVFAAIADQTTWPRWCFDLVSSTWLHGATAGAVSAVRLAVFGKLTFEERILAWDPDRRFAFSVDACTIKIARRAAEDWVLEPTPDGAGTVLTWTLAAEVSPLAVIFWPLGRLILRRVFARTARGLQRFLADPQR